jgi:SAM-dependent methyltransferase
MSDACPLCCGAHHVRVAVSASARLVRCRACGLLYSDPLPAERVRTHYEDVYAHDALSEHIDRRRRALFAGFLQQVRPFGDRRLLDVGCGSGEFLVLAREHGWQTQGIEISSQGAALARRRGLVVHGDPGELPDGRFDAVTLWNVIDFFLRPLEQMREVHRLLVPGGLVFLRTPNAVFQLAAWRLGRVVVWPPALARLVAEAHFFQPLVWGPATVRLLLARGGFTDVRIRNSTASHGDPYHDGSRARERLVSGVKTLVHALAQGLYRASGGRLTVGSSISVLARKPG